MMINDEYWTIPYPLEINWLKHGDNNAKVVISISV